MLIPIKCIIEIGEMGYFGKPIRIYAYDFGGVALAASGEKIALLIKNPPNTVVGKYMKIGIKVFSEMAASPTFDNPFGTNFVGEWNVERLF
jgi:hypothetical protein